MRSFVTISKDILQRIKSIPKSLSLFCNGILHEGGQCSYNVLFLDVLMQMKTMYSNGKKHFSSCIFILRVDSFEKRTRCINIFPCPHRISMPISRGYRRVKFILLFKEESFVRIFSTLYYRRVYDPKIREGPSGVKIQVLRLWYPSPSRAFFAPSFKIPRIPRCAASSLLA